MQYGLKYKNFFKIFFLAIFSVSFFLFPKQTNAWEEFACDPGVVGTQDPDVYCQDLIDGFLNNHAGSLGWCSSDGGLTHNIDANCSPNDMCNFFCTDPLSPIECFGAVHCDGEACIEGRCGGEVSDNECDSEDDCFQSNGGPCAPDEPAYCVLETPGDPESPFVCECDSIFPTPEPDGGGLGGQEALCGDDGIDTAIGCIRVNTSENFLLDILPWAAGIGAGIAFLMMIYAGFMIITSAGDPKKLNAGKQLLTAAVTGLLLILLSAYLLRLIGTNILQIPNFGT